MNGAISIAPLNPAERKELRRALGAGGRSKARATALLSRFLLAEVVNRVLTSLSLDELLSRLVALASDTIEAERGTIFLYDSEGDELFSRVAQGDGMAEIRIPRATGIAGAVFESGEPAIVHAAYADPRFNPEVDQRTGFRTESALCVPLREQSGAIIGAVEILNKRKGRFDRVDRILLEAIAGQAATALAQAKTVDARLAEQARDRRLFETAEALTVELQLDRLLAKTVDAAAQLVDAERATLFMHDPATGELWSRVTAGDAVDVMRFPATSGIAGACLATGQVLNVPDAYGDSRFNPRIDAHTGYRTRSLLCAPVARRNGLPLAVLEVLNKRTGRFTRLDERLLQRFAAQIAVALQNAQLVTDLLALRNASDGILRSLSDGVVTLDPQLNILKVNAAARKILRVPPAEFLEGPVEDVWGKANPWLMEALTYVTKTGGTEYRADVSFALPDGGSAETNLTASALRDAAGALTGVALVFQDVSREKHVHATITRYMAREFAERALAAGSDATARLVQVATVLFSDIRRFTTLTETLTPLATVAMLNEYFSEMADLVQSHGGALDKYIGDAVMAVFGAAASEAADADNAVTAATEMIRRLKELNRRRAARGAQPLEISIGLASGEIAVGPVGSPSRVDYTAIGDSVNLAARLQSANAHYGTTILIAGATVERLAAKFRLRRLDLVRVKGKGVPTEVFEVMDHYAGDAALHLDEALPLFEDGIRRYRERDFTRALGRFAEVLKLTPNDGPSWIYVDRCLFYRDHPPLENWDGVWNMQTK